MPQMQRPGATINYEIWGEDDGPERAVVTLVNGHTRPLNDFRLMGRHLAERGFKVLALDNRGAGRSDPTRAFTFQDMVDDVAALLDAEGCPRSHLLGISMGGFIAQSLALQQPQRVRKLVLVSTAANQLRIRHDERPWTTDLAAVDAKLRPYFTAAFAERNELLVKSMVKQIAKAVGEGDYAARADEQRRAIQGFDAADRLAQVRAPTLVIHGDEDGIIPRAAADELARGIAGAQLEILVGAGHLLLAERPKELYQLVATFLAS